ncbi:hypothetical protein BD626DRAFT_548499 [Schizophyllum amplum]|uniref:Uncharacterized protein n=1 Tax=Schizophyllum amplum TaxID=97359 RepID=A0A550CCW3_9AGAR|nr:hypothetical protein BD626DRAFT_548499 [Auriculariopsis ampla]
MPPKRKRRDSPKGLAPGQVLKRTKLLGNASSPWAWVGTDILDAAHITQEHRLAVCGFAHRSPHPFCANRYAPEFRQAQKERQRREKEKKERAKRGSSATPDDDVIVISDSEEARAECSKKQCKGNPNCLNYLGQEKWEDEGLEAFRKLVKLGDSPMDDARDPDLPVGLYNLGATCYANASLQVWYRDLSFRRGVYNCQPCGNESEEKFRQSPLFHLQVTFAALQESTQSVFNPSKLVESLQLRTSEQQDAQEFSKLFMTHLASEFNKQSIPSVRSLVADQFEGCQLYGTRCDTCNSQSERESTFLEIEISFNNNSRLEDCVATSLQPEKLTGDNKYRCETCASLQDATRYTKLRRLPPMLHFSLMRFVYDLKTFERKKSKHTISFPTVLDMGRFVSGEEPSTVAADSINDPSEISHIYDLRGVLLHKGSSAYHGHYEAQVYDTERGCWFQFNDEVVTKIQSLQEKNAKPIVIDVDGEDSDKASAKKNRTNARKRRRVEDSDDDAEPRFVCVLLADPGLHCTKAKRDAKVNGEKVTIEAVAPSPPARAMEAVAALNAEHSQECEKYDAKETVVKQSFRELRRKVMDIYQTWSVGRWDEPSVVVSQSALSAWLLKDCATSEVRRLKPLVAEAKVKANGCSEKADVAKAEPLEPPQSLERHTSSEPSALPEDTNQLNGTAPPTTNGKHKEASEDVDPNAPIRISIEDDILCEHRKLHPSNAVHMKRIRRDAYDRIIADTDCAFEPLVTPQDVCTECVEGIFKDRLYQVEHPRLVSQFDDVAEVPADQPGYWISKLWVKDWRMSKPKMHKPDADDPAPDADDFKAHVFCEHGRLTNNVTNRRRISLEAGNLLQALFPSLQLLSSAEEPCAICAVAIHSSKEGKLEARKKAEDEKARLKHMLDHALNGDTALLEDTPLAVVPAQFVRAWKLWLGRPTEYPRPPNIDNSPFFCEHDQLAFDPNSVADMDANMAVIKRVDWDVLQSIYPCGPLIALEKESLEKRYRHDIPVCMEKSDWQSTEITIRQGDPDKAKPTTTQKTGGSRQSKRLRSVKEHGERRKMTVTKSMTVKELKIMIDEEMSIPTICQRLFYQGKELDDNEATMQSLNIFANDVIDLRQAHEIHSLSDDDGDEPAKKRQRSEERGFGGTLLGAIPSSDLPTPPPDMKSCPYCTVFNARDAEVCETCDGALM